MSLLGNTKVEQLISQFTKKRYCKQQINTFEHLVRLEWPCKVLVFVLVLPHCHTQS